MSAPIKNVPNMKFAAGANIMTKLIKAELTFKRDDGSLYTETVEGEEAEKWNEMSSQLAFAAQIHGIANWKDIQWRHKEVNDRLPEDVRHATVECKSHCNDCDRPWLCDIIKDGSQPCKMFDVIDVEFIDDGQAD